MVWSIAAYGQLTTQFYIENNQQIKGLILSLSVDEGNCHIGSTRQEGLLKVSSNKDPDHFSHSYSKVINRNVCFVDLDIKNTGAGAKNLGQTISTSIFGTVNTIDESKWNILLSENKPYQLRLNYGMGAADIDLSRLSIETIKIHTGSADVKIGYEENSFNKVEMDTFYVKVDFGSVNVHNLCHSRARNVIADVGFGDLILDLSDPPLQTSKIIGNVGAGTLLIKLPSDNTPVRVVVNDSWLCNLKIPVSFRKIGENTYVNPYYKGVPERALSFEVDVSMGNLIFREP